MLRRRLALTGNQADAMIDFPPDVLFAQGMIDQDMRDEALRFAMLAWLLFKSPTASCAAIYERMVAEGFGGGDFAPRTEGETDELYHARIRSQKARFHRMLEALGAVTTGPIEETRIGGRQVIYRAPIWTRIEGTMFEAVRNSTQFLQPPRLVLKLAASEAIAPEDWAEMTRLSKGFKRLVAARSAEDRHWRRRRAHHETRIGAANNVVSLSLSRKERKQ